MEKYHPLSQDDSSSTDFLIDGRYNGDIAGGVEGRETPFNGQRSWWRRHFLHIITHTILFGLNALFCVLFVGWTASQYSHGPQNLNSPARDVIGYEARQFELLSIYLPDGTLNPNKPTAFSGYPRLELEEAWSNLTDKQNIRIHENELGEFAGDDSLIKLSDGSGYYGTLAVFHGLHCVERFHHYMHKDHYYPDLSDSDAMRLRHHTEHCLDWLRQSIQCNADNTVMMMHWDENRRIPVAKDTGKHQCVSWAPFRQWVEERYFDVFEPGLLVHPRFGAVFDGSAEGSQGDKIGIVSGGKLLHTGSSARRDIS